MLIEKYNELLKKYDKETCEEIVSLLEDGYLFTSNDTVYSQVIDYLNNSGIHYTLEPKSVSFKYKIRLSSNNGV